jgi:hypothetical protein
LLSRHYIFFLKLLSRNRFLRFAVKIREKSQNVVLICNFLCTCPRLLSNFC